MIDRFNNEAKIKELHPQLHDRVRGFINEAELHGIILKITEAFRSFERQQLLYDQGRTTSGNIVTNAKPGQSSHQYRIAVDVVPIVDGQVDWNSEQWDKIGELGKAQGFVWGGDFKNLIDKPHFEWPEKLEA